MNYWRSLAEMKKKTNLEFKSEVLQLVGNSFIPLTKSFKIAKLRDNIKTWYCQSHNLYLIRIPYTAKTKSEIAQYLYML